MASFTLNLPTSTSRCVIEVVPEVRNPHVPPAWKMASVSMTLMVSFDFTRAMMVPPAWMSCWVLAPSTELATRSCSFCST